jgi:Domain of unknown function (DUF1707)
VKIVVQNRAAQASHDSCTTIFTTVPVVEVRVIPDGNQGEGSAILTLMVEPSEMRASDADRDRISAVLREAHAEGRLPQDELLERLDAAYDARTYGELDRLVADLPTPRRQVSAPVLRPASAPVPQQQKGPSKFLRANWWLWGSAVSINLVIWVLVAITNSEGAPDFWPMWVAGPWGALLVVWTLADNDRRRRG